MPKIFALSLLLAGPLYVELYVHKGEIQSIGRAKFEVLRKKTTDYSDYPDFLRFRNLGISEIRVIRVISGFKNDL